MENSFGSELEESIEKAQLDNAGKGQNGSRHPDDFSPDIAAGLYFSDHAWKERFLARCDNERARLRAEAEEELLRAQEALAALSEDEGAAPKLKPLAKAKPRAKKVAKRIVVLDPGREFSNVSARALALIASTGSKGLGTVRLSRTLGSTAGPIVAPLIEAGKVKSKGQRRGTTYFSVGST